MCYGTGMRKDTFYLCIRIIFFIFVIPSCFASTMISPQIDANANQPFSYFSKPTDEIGFMDTPYATEITPEGYLYTGFTELLFLVGSELTPISQRIRTLEKGYLPIIHYTYNNEGIAYHFTLFSTTLNNKPNGTLVNFVKVNITNETNQPRRMDFAIATRYKNNVNTEQGVGDNRFKRPYKSKYLGDYQQVGVEFKKDWRYAFKENAFLRDNKILYVFEEAPQKKLFTLKNNGYVIPDLTPRPLNILVNTPVGIARYARKLNPHENITLIFKMPVIPSVYSQYKKILTADFNEYKKRTIQNWQTILNKGMRIEIPEAKMTDTFNASLIYDLLARDKIDNHYIQTVNKLQYHEFFLRDAAEISHMYDLTGYPDYAGEILQFFKYKQQADGNFLSQPEEFDAWGQTLWAYGQHYRMTEDKQFAKNIYPQIKKAVAWLKNVRQKDPLHLIPATHGTDNENVAGHITGYNFLALAGLKQAILLADVSQHTNDVRDFKKEYEDYQQTFLNRLHLVATTSIPPTLDGTYKGQDWGNLLGAYPETILDPHDPLITATLKNVRNKYQEGIMTYGDGKWLHHYLTIKNTLTSLLRDEQEQVLQEFYSVLVHTSSTHAGFEFGIHPWGNRNFEANLAPHGWFASEYRTLLRNMLVREQNDELHLLSVMSPAWIGTGKTINVERAPTEFGTVNFQLQQANDTQATLNLSAVWRHTPRAIVIHMPWFMNVEKIRVDGKLIPILTNNSIRIPADAKLIHIEWSKQKQVDYSYEKAVTDYKQEYKRRYEIFMHG